MRTKRIRKTKTLKDEKGQNLVEFALVVPLLLLLVIGIAELGRAWMTKNLITGAAREAVRIYAVKNAISEADARADNILRSGNLDPARWTITHIPPPSPPSTDRALGYRIDYNFPLAIAGFIPGLPNDNIPLSSTTTMRREWDF
jgi:hypothetical protein